MHPRSRTLNQECAAFLSPPPYNAKLKGGPMEPAGFLRERNAPRATDSGGWPEGPVPDSFGIKYQTLILPKETPSPSGNQSAYTTPVRTLHLPQGAHQSPCCRAAPAARQPEHHRTRHGDQRAASDIPRGSRRDPCLARALQHLRTSPRPDHRDTDPPGARRTLKRPTPNLNEILRA